MSSIIGSLSPKIEFFPISVNDSRWLHIFDVSDWKHLEDEVKHIGIRLPGSRKFQEHYYHSKTINIFNSNTLGLSSGLEIDCLVSLPDGIYEIEVYICDVVKETKLIYRYELLQEEIDKKVLELGNSYKSKYGKFGDIYSLMEGSKSMARCGDTIKAMALYNQVKDMVKFI
jgi:hypothetical protein